MVPSLFLFDEPFGALDAMNRERLGDELRALFADRGFAALFVTHDVAEAVFLSGRFLVMAARGGRIVADIAVPAGLRPPGARCAPEPAGVAAEVHARLRQAGDES